MDWDEAELLPNVKELTILFFVFAIEASILIL